MSTDVMITAGIAVAQLITTIYGVLVSIAEKHLRVAAVLGLVGGIGVALTVWAAIRNDRAQTGLQTQLNQIQKNTEKPQPAPIVNVNPPPVYFPPQEAFMTLIDRKLNPVKISDHIGVNFTSKNLSGAVSANSEVGWSTVYVVETKQTGMGTSGKEWMVPSDVEDDYFVRFLKEVAKTPPAGDRMYGPNETTWTTALGPELDEQMSKELTNQTKAILHVVEYRWNDSAGVHINDVCEWLQPNSFLPNNPEVWHYCSRHNGEVKKRTIKQPS